MSKPELIKQSGWAFIASAIAFITILNNSDPIAVPGSVISAILLAVGMWRLRTAFRESISRIASNFLLLGMLGPVLWVFGIAFMAVMGVEAVGKGLWVLLFAGPAFSLLGLTLFGLAALSGRPMPRLNWLPLFAGFWYPVTFTLFSIYDISHKGVFPDQFIPELVFSAVIQFLGLSALGIVLISDPPTTDLATT